MLPLLDDAARPDLRSLSFSELSALVSRLGERPYRARQLYSWLHRKGAASLDAMTDLPSAFRERLAAETRLATLAVDAVQESSDGTRKYRMRTQELLLSEEGANFSHRHVTVSTSGLVPNIVRFGEESQVKLAVSLNATTDEQRAKLMPVDKKWNIAALIDAVRKFPSRQGRRVTFEYVLLRDVNDSDEDAARLAALLRDLPVKVNLIPYNENPGLGFGDPGAERVAAFRKALSARGITAMVRKNRGRDIAAACGQLAVQV